MPKQAKKVSQSRVELAQVAMPDDANPAGNVHGGAIMKLIDNAAGVVAMRHTRRNIVTASIDRLDFHHPVFVGNLIILKASINRVGNTSMEVGVRVEAENIMTGEIRHTASAYLTFVALSPDGCPTQVPALASETDEDRRRLSEAIARYKTRKLNKRK
ncbi:MAG: acyl-CoA thioesterase [Pedobacter sp.]